MVESYVKNARGSSQSSHKLVFGVEILTIGKVLNTATWFALINVGFSHTGDGSAYI